MKSRWEPTDESHLTNETERALANSHYDDILWVGTGLGLILGFMEVRLMFD